jgi:hypothetical protein
MPVIRKNIDRHPVVKLGVYLFTYHTKNFSLFFVIFLFYKVMIK